MRNNHLEPNAGGSAQLANPLTGRDLAVVTGVGQQTTGSHNDLNLASLWRIVNEWRWLILGSVALALAGAVIVTLLTKPAYRAATVLEINPPAIEILENAKAQPAVQNDIQFLTTQYGLLQSRSLAERVAQDLNLASNEDLVGQDGNRGTRQKIATSILTQNFEVKPVKGSRLIEILYSAPTPDLAAAIVNSFADNFINSNLERRYEASSYARNFLQNQLRTIKAELEKSERQLVAYAQQQGIINASGDAAQGSDASSLAGASLVAINNALAEALTKRITAEQRYREAVGSASQVVQSTSALRGQKAALEAEYQDKLTSFKPDYPDMVRIRERIQSIDQSIRRESGAVASGNASGLKAEYDAAVAEEKSLQSRVNQLRGSVLNLRGRSIQYNILQREVDTNRSLYDALLQRYKEIGVSGGIGTNLVSVVDRAEAPGGAYKPNLPLNLAIGLIAGLLFGIGAAIAIEFINDTIKTPDDVRNKLRLPSLGVIPKKAGQRPLRDELRDQASPISEAYFSLRTALQFTTDQGAPSTLLVTSTRAAEGKSSTTLALAQNFARLGISVLLIDGDLRKPAFVAVDAKEGLSTLLTTSMPIKEHVLQTEVEGLWLLPSGPIPPNPAELLASPRVATLINEASADFDMVIIDGPPVLGLADAPLLSASCRGTLMVIESGKTRTKAAVDALNRLRSAGAVVLGATLTKYRHQTGGYGYNYEPYKYGGIGSRERDIHLISST